MRQHHSENMYFYPQGPQQTFLHPTMNPINVPNQNIHQQFIPQQIPVQIAQQNALRQRNYNIHRQSDIKRQKREMKLQKKDGGILGLSAKKRAEKCLIQEGQIQVAGRPQSYRR